MAEWAELVKPPDLADVRHMCMYLKKHREGASYCTYGRVGLEQPAELVAHPTVTRSLTTSSQYSRTGGVGMLACGPVQTISQNQHMPSPCAHTSEVVAASTFLNHIVPTAGTRQELRIQCGHAVPYYLDSQSTVFVSKDDKAVKKSV